MKLEDLAPDKLKMKVDLEDKALLYMKHRAEAIKGLQADLKNIYYDSDSGKFFKKSKHGDFIKFTEGAVKRYLKIHGFKPAEKTDDEHHPIDYAFDEIMEERAVEWVGQLGGYRPGLHTIQNGTRVLIRKGASLPKPKPGDYSAFDRFFRGILKTDEQINFFYSWLQVCLSELMKGSLRSGPAIVLASPKNFGKSLFKKLVSKVLGGRAADATKFMKSRTDFNADLFGSELWTLDDTVPATQYNARLEMGKLIKQVVASNDDSCHPKRRDALPVRVWRRLMIFCNDDAESLKIIPPLDGQDHLSDKLAILKAHKQDLSYAGLDEDEKESFDALLDKQLPAFADYILNHFKIPESARLDKDHVRRWGFDVIQSSEVVSAVRAEQKEMKLHEMIQEHITHSNEWRGKASALVDELQEVVELRQRMIDLRMNTDTVSKLLTNLAAMKPDIYTKPKKDRYKGQEYFIKPEN